MRNYTLIVLGMLLVTLCNGQRSWEGGIHLGTTSYQGDLNPNDYPVPEALDVAYGLFLRRNLSPVWALRLDVRHGTWRGDDAYSEGLPFEQRQYSFRNGITHGLFLVEWDPFGKSRYPEGPYKFRPRITPYLSTGAGALRMNPQTDFGHTGGGARDADLLKDQSGGVAQWRFAVPAGGGIKLDLGFRTTLGLEMHTTYAWTDLVDGVSATGNSATNDWIVSGGANLTLRFAARDSDGDGVVDKEDACPDIAGNISARGCPDRDGDGVEDAEDVCPDLAGLMEFSGCPDTDGDGFMDPADGCPTEYGYEETNGCPDRDNDCVADAEDVCPTVAGLVEFSGCPDTDGDGLPDPDDPCPTEAGLPENGGCPLPDTDCDGIIDALDQCPTIADTLGFTGCPDRDLDGVTDSLDRCPGVAGTAVNAGCPELDATEKALLIDAQREVQFRTGSAELLASSRTILDDIRKLLEKYDIYHLRLKGYTDSVGSSATNQKLSEQRARACYEYLKGNGISEERMSYAGYGEKDPIGDNKTATGRRKNRRVEFELYLPDEQ